MNPQCAKGVPAGFAHPVVCVLGPNETGVHGRWSHADRCDVEEGPVRPADRGEASAERPVQLVSGNCCIVWTNYRHLDQLPTLQRSPLARDVPPSSTSPADASAPSYTWPYTRSVIAGSWPSHFAAAETVVPLLRASIRRSGESGGPNGYSVEMDVTDHRPKELQEQAHQYADQARKQADFRRAEQDGGVSGWIADRAGEWELEGLDERTMQRQKYLWNFLVDYWFRMEMDGWENLPEPPALLIGIHSGAPFVWDAWTVGVQWWRRFGQERQLHGTAHDVLMAIPGIGRYFRAMGVLPAAPDSIATALAEGRDVALWPGGEVDSLRPWSERDRANLAGRTGFVKMAIRAGVPIVPIATVGGADAMPVLFRGDRLARVLGLGKVLRLKVFPLAVSLPWGIAPAALPQFPLPAKIRTRLMPAIELEHDPDRAADDEYVERKYQEVQDGIQVGMDALARKRALPLFG
jgi:1-acyl-sn-glycerol-3-phosphate acyltransferase